MPLKTPFSATNKSDTNPKGKAAPPSGSAKGKGGSVPPKSMVKGKSTAPKKGKVGQPPPAPPVFAPLSRWDSLSAERKLDVVGAVMAVVGLLAALILFSASRSPITEAVMQPFSQTLGWGVYILPVGMLLMGVWLLLQRIDKLPPLSVERATGIVLFFFWLLAAMHFMIADPAFAEAAALDGAGGNYNGSYIDTILFNNIDMLGALVVVSAWLVINVNMIYDMAVEDMFQWVGPA